MIIRTPLELREQKTEESKSQRTAASQRQPSPPAPAASQQKPSTPTKAASQRQQSPSTLPDNQKISGAEKI